jgi:hypothetical protein
MEFCKAVLRIDGTVKPTWSIGHGPIRNLEHAKTICGLIGEHLPIRR